MTLLHYFLDVTSLYTLEQKFKNIFVHLLAQIKTLRFAFEIYRPLVVHRIYQILLNLLTNQIAWIDFWLDKKFIKIVIWILGFGEQIWFSIAVLIDSECLLIAKLINDLQIWVSKLAKSSLHQFIFLKSKPAS